MRALLFGLLLGVSSAHAGGPLIDNSETHKQKQIAVQVTKAGAAAAAAGGPSSATVTMPAGVKQNFPPVAANPNAHPPSAQCRFGESGTLGVQEFGLGYSGSFWDRICGLWLAAQQTTGDARDEAATAAFCLTMKDAGVQSPTCVDWSTEQGTLMVAAEKRVQMSDNKATIVFGGSGSGGWN